MTVLMGAADPPGTVLPQKIINPLLSDMAGSPIIGTGPLSRAFVLLLGYHQPFTNIRKYCDCYNNTSAWLNAFFWIPTKTPPGEIVGPSARQKTLKVWPERRKFGKAESTKDQGPSFYRNRYDKPALK